MSGALIMAIDVTSVLLCAIGCTASIRGRSPYAWPVLAAGNFLALIGAVAVRMWPFAAVDAACLLFALWMWWRNRKNKGRLRALLSGKYAHVRDGMVRVLRDRRVARPALAPGRAS